MTDEPYPYRTSDRRVIPLLLFGLVVLFGAVYVAGYLFTSDRIPRGTTVDGLQIGGLTPAAAERRLTEQLRPRAVAPITVGANGERATIAPARAGLALDVPASVGRAGAGRSWDPRRMWDYFAGGNEVSAVTTSDPEALDRVVAGFADKVDVPATEGKVTFGDGMATPRYSEAGTVVDRDAAATALREAFVHSDEPVALPTVTAEPKVSKEAVSRAMDRFANPAMSGPVVIRLGRERVRLDPEEFSPALTMEAVGSELRPRLDDKVLLRALRPKIRKSTLAPRDATVRIVKGKPRVVPGRNGVTFDPDEVTTPFLELLTNRGSARTLAVRAVSERPDVTTADARKLRITERVSTFTTSFPHAAYRNVNLGRAAELVNGTVLRPGETFSLNDTVGERTAANGFTEGFIISDGVYKEDLGGGVSQVATTLFNAAFFAGLEDVEHKAHSFYISRYPVGREATVAWPSVDLKFKNTTPYGVLIQASIDNSTPSSQGAMHVTMWSTKHWDITTTRSQRYHQTQPDTRHLSGDGCVPNDGYAGFDIDVFRLFHKHGSRTLDHREKIHTTYTPSDTVVCS